MYGKVVLQSAAATRQQHGRRLGERLIYGFDGDLVQISVEKPQVFAVGDQQLPAVIGASWGELPTESTRTDQRQAAAAAR